MKHSLYMSPFEAEQVHDATLQVLEKTGIFIDHPRARKALLDKGASTDRQERVLLPRQMVETSVEIAARSFQLYDRNGTPAFEVKFGPSYFGTGSDALYQRDPQTGEIRESDMDDIARNASLIDELEYDFIMSTALPRGIPPHRLYPEVFAQMVRHTEKPIVTTATTVEDIKSIHRINRILNRGGEFKPNFIAYLEPMSPLIFNHSSVERLIYCAENDIPFVYASGSNLGTGAPVTPEGGLVQGSAESLAGLVIACMFSNRPRFVYGANNSSSDMRTGMVCYGPTEWPKTSSLYAEMGRFYNLPSWGTAGSTDARHINAQAGWEAYRGIVMALLSRSTIVHNMAYMSFGELYDQDMILLASEMLKDARHMLKPVRVNEIFSSVDVIDEVARKKSHYLAHKDTAEKFRENLLRSPVINRSKIGTPYEQIHEKLSKRGKKLLKNHKPDPLPSEIATELESFLKTLD